MHPWTNLVVGGIGNPRFLVLYDNLCTNPRMSNNATGWVASSANLTIQRVADVDSYGEYSLNMFWSQSLKEYVSFDCGDVGSLSVLSKVLVAMRIKDNLYTLSGGSRPITIGLWQGDEKLSSREIVIDGKMKNIAILFEGMQTNPENPSTNMYLRIYTSIDFFVLGDIRFDNVYINFVKEDYQFDAPQDTYIDNDKNVIGSHELFDGRVVEYNKSWKPIFYAAWEVLTRAKEIGRQRIAESSRVFVIPHIDFLWGFFAKWDDKFSTKYSYKRYFGHASEITLVGDELIIGTIHPTISEYIPTPAAVTILITTNYDDKKGTLIYVSPEDANGFTDGSSPFSRSFQAGTDVTLLAPDSISVEGVTHAFQDWYDITNSVVLSTDRLYSFTISATANVQARFALAGGGAGDGYGTDYGGTGYGDVL